MKQEMTIIQTQKRRLYRPGLKTPVLVLSSGGRQNSRESGNPAIKPENSNTIRIKNHRSMEKNSLFSTKRNSFLQPLFYHLRKHSHRSKGQVTVELILLSVVLIVLSQLVINQIKTNNYIKNFAKGPSEVVANMMANGNWKKNSEESKAEHPNIHEKHYSWNPL